MAGDKTGWLLIGGASLGLFGWTLACQDPATDTDEPVSASTQAVLDAVGPSVVVPALSAFRSELVALNASLASDDNSASRRAFADAMHAWQYVDVLRVPPRAGADALALRDEIYSWPVTNACRVDQVTASGAYDDVASLLVNARGLDALEYLLYADTDNACPSQVAPNSDGAWDALSSEQIAAARTEYAQAIGVQLTADLDVLTLAWGDADVPSLQAVLDGVFALETVIKDRKLGHPLGLVDCTGDACLDDAEGQPDSASSVWVAQNLRGFRALFTGLQGAGLSDLLIDQSEDALVTELLAQTDDAIAMAESLDPNLRAAIETDRDAVVALYELVDAIDETLRVDVTALLMLELPPEVGGDVD